MEANELRVRNYVDWNGEIGIISQILENEVCFKCGEEALLSEIKPIFLNEEWLLKLGFENLNYGWYLNKIKLFDYSYKKGSINLKINSFDVPSTQIKYVHQLQNLYFALKEEELTLKN